MSEREGTLLEKNYRQKSFYLLKMSLIELAYWVDSKFFDTKFLPNVYFQNFEKGAGTLLHVLHVCHSFRQKCSKIGTHTTQGL
jgi:hypothetical protein